jgi:hypothetical protein
MYNLFGIIVSILAREELVVDHKETLLIFSRALCYLREVFCAELKVCGAFREKINSDRILMERTVMPLF